MADRQAKTARWTEKPPQGRGGAYQVVYREFRDNQIVQVIGSGSNRAKARSDAAEKFRAKYGELPYGFSEPTPE